MWNVSVIISEKVFVLAIFCVWPHCTMCEESLWPFLLNTKIQIFQIITGLIDQTEVRQGVETGKNWIQNNPKFATHLE